MDIIRGKNSRSMCVMRDMFPMRGFHEFVNCHIVTPSSLYNSIKRKLRNFPVDSSLSVTFCFATLWKGYTVSEGRDIISKAISWCIYAEIETESLNKDAVINNQNNLLFYCFNFFIYFLTMIFNFSELNDKFSHINLFILKKKLF